MRALGDTIKERETALAEVEERLKTMLLEIPNIPLADVPDGGEEDSVVLRHVGEPPQFDFEVKDHLDLGTRPRPHRHGARRQGERLALRLPQGRPRAAAVRPGALRPRHHRRQGLPAGHPAGAGARGGDVRHRLLPHRPRAGLRDRRRRLPGGHQRGAAGGHAHGGVPRGRASCRCATPATPRCFRREAGAAGRDTRGILRVHQFDKVEMFSFCLPEQSAAEHELILSAEEEILQGLGIPYRVVNIAAGDLGAPAAQKFDCEAWMPGPAAVPRGHELLQLHRLPGAAPRTAATAPRRARASCTR